MALAVFACGIARNCDALLDIFVEPWSTSPAEWRISWQCRPVTARVAASAMQALGDDDEARTWLTQTHPMLGHPSIDPAATDLGARQVARHLHDIEHNLPV